MSWPDIDSSRLKQAQPRSLGHAEGVRRYKFLSLPHGGEDALEQHRLTDVRSYPPDMLGE